MANKLSFNTVAQDPDFLALPLEEQRKVLIQIDKDFASLDFQTQSSVLNQINPTPTTSQKISKGLKAGREMIRGQEGMIVGATVGGIVGGVPGAGLVGGVGQAAQQAAKKPRTPRERLISQSLSGFPPAQGLFELQRGVQTPQEFGRVAGATGLSLFGESLGVGASKLMSRVIAPFEKSLVQGFQKAKDLFKSVGGRFTPGQATKESGLGSLIDFAEEFTEGSVTGSGPIKAFKETQQRQVTTLADDLTKQITTDMDTLSDDAIGDFVLTTLKEGESLHNSAATKLYAQVDDVLGTQKIQLNSLKKAANDLDVSVSKGRELVLAPETRDTINLINKLDPQMTFTELHGIRSGLLKRIRDLEASPGKAQASGQLKRLVSAIDDTMETSAKDLSKEGLKLWRQANTFYKEGKTVFGNDLLTKILQKETINAEKIGEKVFARGNVQEIRQLRQGLQFAEILSKGKLKAAKRWQAMQAGHLRQLLAPDQEGRVVGTKIIRAFNDPKQLRTMKEIYSPEQLNTLRNFANVANLTQKRLGSGGTIAAKIMQVSAGAQLLFSPFQEEGGVTKAILDPLAGGILIGPALFGRLITSPIGIKWLTTGFKANLTGRIPATFTTTTGAIFKKLLEEQ